MPTVQEIIDRRRILEEAKKGMRKERVQQVKQEAQRIIKKVRTAKLSPVYGKPSAKPQSAFLRFFGQAAVKGKSIRPVGRPKGILKHTSPITGKPIKAQDYYRELRAVKRQQANIFRQRQLAIQQQLAKRGILPQAQPTQMPTQQQIVTPVPSQAQIQQGVMPQRSIWNRQQGQFVQDAGLFGKRIIKIGVPESFWN